jgi:hypothetical protein
MPKVNVSDCTVTMGGENDARNNLALALKAMADAAKALAQSMGEGSYGLYFAGDTVNNFATDTAPGTESGNDDTK